MIDPEIFTFGTRRSNAEVIVDAHHLGYVDGVVLDMTVGPAGFWQRHRPDVLITNDIDPAVAADLHHDYRVGLPFPDRAFDAVVLDPPYKLTGTVTDNDGPAALNDSYGVTDGLYRRVDDLYRVGIDEGLRLTRRYLLVKTQDQISSGKYQPLSFNIWRHATQAGATLVDQLYVCTTPRRQPAGRRQVHARASHSVLMVFKRGRR